MTVMVTGASGVIGRATVRALLARDEVRATVRREADAAYLRQLGAKVAVRELDGTDALAEILPRCHTLVHLVGGVDQPDPPVAAGVVADLLGGQARQDRGSQIDLAGLGQARPGEAR